MIMNNNFFSISIHLNIFILVTQLMRIMSFRADGNWIIRIVVTKNICWADRRQPVKFQISLQILCNGEDCPEPKITFRMCIL